MAEDLIAEYGKNTGSNAYIFRLANAFGKWCKPNYNSVVATFCHNIANNIDIEIKDGSIEISFVYIDDIVNEFMNCLDCIKRDGILSVNPVYPITIDNLAKTIKQFRDSRINNILPNLKNDFYKKLYSTYLSYLPENKFSYPLKMNADERGSFSEFIKTDGYGQVSVNISKPGIVKGNHWHHTKNEKFLVVSGKGIIRFREIGKNKIIEYYVSDEKLEVVDIPPGYTHNIENLGDTDMVTIMWANELFDVNKLDTFYEKV
ncbi:UDP-2-acetamido-2,6-beta-L-arabino-hexul-4-ose reductase [bioreactor metagenome]|uniref:UDP-2-acetamido-2,6-beta-L-arabino-hexul-4-ose reductase n=1 Tax=bioreactor metagenome TaxID=1076179 RepID=A0A645B3Q7_9ZZZZ